MEPISETDLIINPNGSIYHLNLMPGDIGNTVITVGDPDRVAEVSKHFDRIELKKGKREFISHTGYVGSKRVTVISTGISTDNIDIVFNELDALVNIDFSTRTVKNNIQSLDIIRIGTSGTIQTDIAVDDIVFSAYGLGFDSLMHYYTVDLSEKELLLNKQVTEHFSNMPMVFPYICAADPDLMNRVGRQGIQGITVTAPGFYAPQGRQVRARNAVPDFLTALKSFRSAEERITNIEMETAGIYAMARALGHKALSVNAILASRINKEFSKDPYKAVEKAIMLVLERI